MYIYFYPYYIYIYLYLYQSGSVCLQASTSLPAPSTLSPAQPPTTPPSLLGEAGPQLRIGKVQSACYRANNFKAIVTTKQNRQSIQAQSCMPRVFSS